jgi:hypothetical protein
MPFFVCPECEQPNTVPDRAAGRATRCRFCEWRLEEGVEGPTIQTDKDDPAFPAVGTPLSFLRPPQTPGEIGRLVSLA